MEKNEHQGVVLTPEQQADASQQMADATPPAKAIVLVSDNAKMVMQMVHDAAGNPNIDVTKMQALWAMKKDIDADDARKAFQADYVRMKPHLPKVIRSKKNTQTKSNYAPLEDINEVVDPILEQFNFGTSYEIVKNDAEGVELIVQLIHSQGHVKTTPVWMPIDKAGIQGTVNKTGPHATSSSIMYARRVGKALLLDISTGDDKDGNASGDQAAVITVDQVKLLSQLLVESKTNKEKFLKIYEVETLEALLQKDFQDALNLLQERKKDKQAAPGTQGSQNAPTGSAGAKAAK